MAIGLRGLHREVRPFAELALQIAYHYRLDPVITSTFRSLDNQRRLRRKFEECVAKGRFPSAPDCKYPANKPGDSSHNFGLGWDSWVPEKDMPLWTAIREYVGWRVPPNDQIHAEVPGWRDFIA